MKKIRNLICVVVLLFSFSSLVLASETNKWKNQQVQQVFEWVAKKMNIQLNPDVPLPEIKIVSSEEIIEIAVKVIVRDFKDTPFWEFLEGRRQEEIIREAKNFLAQAKQEGNYELAYNNGLYDPYTNIIYLANGSSICVLVHETTHYFQVKYQKRYPASNEVFKYVSEEKRRGISREHQELEEEAERMAEEFREEFFATKITVEVSTKKAP